MLLAQCSDVAVAGTATAAAPDVGTDLPSRCDRVLRTVAAQADLLAVLGGPTGVRTELVVDDDYPLDIATVHLAAALIADETVLLGLGRSVGARAVRYMETLAALLPGGVLRVAHGDRLVRGGTDRVVWLSPTCAADRSAVADGLVVLMTSRSASRVVAHGTSDPARIVPIGPS